MQERTIPASKFSVIRLLVLDFIIRLVFRRSDFMPGLDCGGYSLNGRVGLPCSSEPSSAFINEMAWLKQQSQAAGNTTLSTRLESRKRTENGLKTD